MKSLPNTSRIMETERNAGKKSEPQNRRTAEYRISKGGIAALSHF
ncbi:hypothetical protein D1BOALGB6SA_3802 [Olavius sp. associated proteobacterium Delta 1]|nr:hypothetical protein D1BOALGB6SA_3802 [Olavius sp. associated proteobacterium Delta 1]